MRQRAAVKAHAMQSSSLPDAAAAAALSGSAAARRIQHRKRHRCNVQAAEAEAWDLRKRLANKHARAHAFSMQRSSNSSNAA